MTDRVEMTDKLTAVTMALAGVSQLMMMLYEDVRQNGSDVERVLVLTGAINRCRDELDEIKLSLQE